MPTASENIPIIAKPWVSDNAKKTLDIVEKFVNEECLPADPVYASQLGEGAQRWGGHPSVIDALKEKAKKLGLWNMFLAKGHYKEGAGFSNLEYGLIAEQLGKSSTASEVCYQPHLIYQEWTLMCLTGHQLCCARYWKYGGDRSLWYPRTEGEVVEASARRQDSVCFSHDRARYRLFRCQQHQIADGLVS